MLDICLPIGRRHSPAIQAQDMGFVTEVELSCTGFFFFLLFRFFLGLVLEDVAGKASSDSASLSRGFRFSNDSLRICGGRCTRDVGAGIVESMESTGSVTASRLDVKCTKEVPKV